MDKSQRAQFLANVAKEVEAEENKTVFKDLEDLQFEFDHLRQQNLSDFLYGDEDDQISSKNKCVEQSLNLDQTYLSSLA